MQFRIWKRDSFYKAKGINGLCGDKHSFAVQASQRLDAEIAENRRFRTELAIQ